MNKDVWLQESDHRHNSLFQLQFSLLNVFFLAEVSEAVLGNSE